MLLNGFIPRKEHGKSENGWAPRLPIWQPFLFGNSKFIPEIPKNEFYFK